MLRRLAYVAKSFARADDPAEVLSALDAVAGAAGMSGFMVSCIPTTQPMSRAALDDAILFYVRAKTDFTENWDSEYLRRGPALPRRHAELNPPPFTSVEAMRLLQPSGEDRWVFDLFRDYGARDALWCGHGPWMVVYFSDRTLMPARFPSETRAALHAAGAMATNRLKELTFSTGVRPSLSPPLSPREKTVLRHLADGLTVAQIAARLSVGEESVQTFIKRVKRKLGAKSRPHAVALGLSQRLI